MCGGFGMGACVVWVRWVSRRYSGWYVGPGHWGLLTFALVSGLQLARHNCGSGHFFSVVSSQLETMVSGALVRASALRVGLGVGGSPSRLDRVFGHHIHGLRVC